MSVAKPTSVDSAAAKRIWDDYQKQHDLSARTGQTAGIDPISGRIWFGESIQDVVAQRDEVGFDAPIYCVRIGSPCYYRKGGHR